MARPLGTMLEEDAEAKAAFHLRMRARGIHDLAVLRAFELVSREPFVPARHLGLVARGLALPIDCGQTSHEPWLSARMIVALGVEPGQRVLEIGAGSGYVTAILATLGAEVIALERFASLASAARARLVTLGVANAAVVWADGLALTDSSGLFDRVLVHGLFDAIPASVTDRLTPDGTIVYGRSSNGAQTVTQHVREHGEVVETDIMPCRFQPIVPRLSSL